jgi:hypothetical protein
MYRRGESGMADGDETAPGDEPPAEEPFPRDETLRGGKRITITCTPGRSGTGFLQRVFALFPDFYSEHESDVPQLQGHLRRAVRDPEFGKRIWCEKFALINARPENRYFESSHLVNKGYIEPLIALGVVPNIIILRRNFREVATSLLRLNTVPARTKKGKKFLLQPDDTGVWQIPAWKQLTDYQLCYWYVLETERRSQHYARLIAEKGGRVFETSVDALVNSEDEFSRLCQFSDVKLADVEEKFGTMKRSKVNDKARKKEELSLPPSAVSAQERSLLDLAGRSTMSIPEKWLRDSSAD